MRILNSLIFVSGCLVEKLPESWKDYKDKVKHKRRQMSLEDMIIHVRIEEKNRRLDTKLAMEFDSKANIVEGNPSSGSSRFRRNPKKTDKKSLTPKTNNSRPFKKNKENCYVCGKPGHHAFQCRHKKDGDNKDVTPKANIVKDDVFAAVVSVVNMVAEKKDWVIDSGATRHICGDLKSFSKYTQVKDGEERIYMGDSRPVPVLGKGTVLLNLTSGKILSLGNVLHVPDIRCNLISVSLLVQAGIKVNMECNKE